MVRSLALRLAVLSSLAALQGCASGAEVTDGDAPSSASGAGAEGGGAGAGGIAGLGGQGFAGQGVGKGGDGSGSAGKTGGSGGKSGGAGGAGGTAQGGAAGQGGTAGGPVCGDADKCDNGADDDCNGVVDDGCTCVAGATVSCFRGPPSVRGKGICRDGMMQCTAVGEFGSWTACMGDTLPGDEICDNGLDDDCDGATDEGCECVVGSPPVACGNAQGTCKQGTQACIEGLLGPCTGSIDPTPELCDNLDNDCDGEVDEGLSRPCGESKGACSPGLQRCMAGQWGACEGAVLASDEVCNGLDDDCDGEIDEEVLVTCGTAEGACKIGTQACQGGALLACQGATGPGDEQCNGVDDDCDGQIDEGLTQVCGSAQGACKQGVSTCKAGAWGACEGEVAPSEEKCDGVDNNCDGTVDEGCGCVVGSAPVPCGSDVGACAKGTQACVGGLLGPCVGAVLPVDEVCNGIDDDCDGEVDEGLTQACGSAVGACKQGVSTCKAGAWGACEGATSPVDEQCNGVDDDCDGVIDEGLSRPCGSDLGRCQAGLQTCAGGVWGACVGEIGPVPEVCDGALDDDCDGVVDDGCGCTAGQTLACGVDVGACKKGLQACSDAGTWGPCVGAVDPVAEACDGVDNDCDGQIDEGCSCIAGELRPCGSNIGLCSYGAETCSQAGSWGACVGGVGPSTELCDGFDNDCDGQVDEGCACVAGQTRPCGSAVGQCKQGNETCSITGQWGACVGGVQPTAEVCNGLDDDCDGTPDDGGVCPTPPPNVTCPGAVSTVAGTEVTLTASGVDPAGGALVYSWSVTQRPAGSTAQPSPSSSAQTKITPDKPGTYELTFCATNNKGVSSCCKAAVTAESACNPPPTGPTASTCGVSWDRRPIVEFDPLPAGTFYEVWQSGVAAPLATITQVGQNYFRPASALGPGGPPPGTPVTLFVKACKTDNPACCSTSNNVSATLVEACSTVTSPTSSNVLFSEYLINGSGGPCPSGSCQAGEAIEITNLSHCPVSLEGHHFGYQNYKGGAYRWMNFTAADVIPPRGVYVAIRNREATACPLPFFGPDNPALFGIKISALDMQGDDLTSGWFNNTGGSMSTLRIATGAWQSITGGAEITKISPYATSNPVCTSVGYNAIDACGDVVAGGVPTTQLTPNQLGRLWHPCDRIVNPVPASCYLERITMRSTLARALFALSLLSTTASAAPSTTLVISEFRTTGPVGGSDEFIEIFNLTNAPIDIGGYKLRGSNNAGSISDRVVFNAGTVIPARGFVLVTNATAGSGYSGTVAGEQTYLTGVADTGGIALTTAANAIIDQVGMSTGSAFKEGTVLAPLTSGSNQSYRRKSGNCTPDVDTDNNSTDFEKVTSAPQNSTMCCADAACNKPPAGQCYGATGTCDTAAGTCSYAIQPGKSCDDGNACTETDVCLVGGACQGSTKACNTPPPPTCVNASTQRSYAATGSCSGGTCTYGFVDSSCSCNAATGLCQDPCAGVTCTTPPNAQCYDAAGTCNPATGACNYTQKATGTTCNDGQLCTDTDKCDATGACVGTPKVCTPPATECVGSSSRVYGGGTCTAATGQCSFTQTDTPCGFGCDAGTGLCKPNPCAGISCITPPNSCFQAVGVCDSGTGQCVYTPKPVSTACDDGVPCTENDVCNGAGTCAGSTKVCTPPGPTCVGNVSRASSGGSCNAANGQCSFTTTDTSCPSGCDSATGLCKNDPCATVTCDQPPSQCHQATGTCSGGTCTYALKPENAACDDGDPCTGPDRCSASGACSGASMVCNTPPSPTCADASTSHAYAPVGTCGGGTCGYAESSVPCAFGCDASTGLCVGDPCSDVTCTTPPSICHVPVGTCSNGTCSYSLKQAGAACDDGDACTTADACNDLGACQGAAKQCASPPPAFCFDDKTSRSAAAQGTCKPDGSCDYATLDTPCALGCDATTGLCSGDLCTGVVCDQPPSACHAPTGTCAGGTCSYTLLQAGAACDDGDPCTTKDACDAAGACAGVAKVCNTPPDPECISAKVSRAANAVGTCSKIDGVCGYDAVDTTCATSCDLTTGLCKDDPCAGVTCDQPPGPCYMQTGTCVNGTCSFEPSPQGAACDDGDACTKQDDCDGKGQCVGVPDPSCGAGGGAGSGGAAGAAGASAGAAGGAQGGSSQAGASQGGSSAGGGVVAQGGSGTAGSGNKAGAAQIAAGASGAGGGAGASAEPTPIVANAPGCGCDVPGRAPQGSHAALAVAGLALAWSRRRRR